MKAVIPAAGLGTRFLPLTKAQPKEMLPVLDKPVIQHVVEEAIGAGCSEILIVTGKDKYAIENHLADLEDVSIYYARQKRPIGLADAVYQAKRFTGNEPFAVLLGDTITVPSCTAQLIEACTEYGSYVAVETVPYELVNRYGIVQTTELPIPNISRITGMVEKPLIDSAPSNLAIVGRYVLTPRIFDTIKGMSMGINQEFQLTDAISLLIEKEVVFAYRYYGRRYDIGNKLDWLKTMFEFAIMAPEFGHELREYMRRVL